MQFIVVVAVGHAVVSGQPDISFFSFWYEHRLAAGVETGEVLGCRHAVAHMVEDVDKRLILLTVDMGELYGDVACLLKRMTAKEIRSIVVRTQQLLVARRDHGCELVKVTDHQQLHTAKGPCRITVSSQHIVDGIEQVAAHHGDLVDDQHVERADDAPFLLAKVIAVLKCSARHIGRERQLEKAVDGHSTCVDGRHAGRCHDDDALGGMLLQRLEEGSLTRSGLSGEKDADAGVLSEFPCVAQLFVFHNVCCNRFVLTNLM